MRTPNEEALDALNNQIRASAVQERLAWKAWETAKEVRRKLEEERCKVLHAITQETRLAAGKEAS